MSYSWQAMGRSFTIGKHSYVVLNHISYLKLPWLITGMSLLPFPGAAEHRQLGGGGGAHIHIFVLCPCN